MSAAPYKQPEQEFKRLHAFRGALALLRWDAAVMMPRGGADARGDPLAALETDQHALPRAGKFPASKQRALAVEVMKSVGFPFERGRLDESEHPFTEGVPGDIRVTTRFDPDDLFSGLLGALHETGHAMYDLGLPQD